MPKPQKPPAFQFYPRDYTSDEKVRRLSYMARGVYVELLCMMWLSGKDRIRNDDEMISRKLGIELCVWENIKAEIQHADGRIFKIRHSYLISDRLKQERAKQKEHVLRKSLAGKAGGTQKEANRRIAEGVAKGSSASAPSSAPTGQKKEHGSAENPPAACAPIGHAAEVPLPPRDDEPF